MWLGLYFVSAKHSLAAHMAMLVVLILGQERHVSQPEPYTVETKVTSLSIS